MIENSDKIWWEDSWLLGWERTGSELTLYVELHLLGNHPLFEPYDRKRDFGCYKTARLVVGGLQVVSGLPSDRLDRRWDETLNEYKDAGDIDVIDIGGDDHKLAMQIGAASEAESFRLEAAGQSINLFFEEF